MNEPLVEHVLKQLHEFVEDAYAHTVLDEDEKTERRMHQGSLALAIRETIREFDVTPEQVRFGITMLVMVYLSAMQDASVCEQNQEYDSREEMIHHKVEHMAACIQDYVIAAAQFPEAEVAA